MSHSETLSARYKQLALKLVAAGDFFGPDARYSGEFEGLETELAKATALNEKQTPVDWQWVLDNCETLLTEQSKDLRVAAWLTWALFQQESFAGLRAGIGLLHCLCRDRWENLHPLKPSTRGAAIAWLVPRLEQVFSQHISLAGQLPLFLDLATQLRGLEACLSRYLGAQAPLLLPTCRRIEEMLERASDNAPVQGTIGGAIEQVKQLASQLISPTQRLENEKDAQRNLRSIQEQAAEQCTYWLKRNACDPHAIRLARTLLWLNVDSAPSCDADHITDLRALPVDTVTALQERFEQGQFADVLLDLEPRVARGPFWLDGQRLVRDCLQALNATQALDELEIQLGLFLRRLPGVLELRFHDGTPFADTDTRTWIDNQIIPRFQEPGDEAALPRSSDAHSHPAWALALQESLPMLRKGGLKAAVQNLKKGMATAQGGRQRFFWKLTLARLCLQARKYDLAHAQLTSLDQQLQASAFGDWEPQLALEVLQLLLTSYDKLGQDPTLREERAEIHRRLCHLDLEEVLD